MTVAINIAKWIIEDGNYGDFHVGDVRQFAVEFYSPKPLVIEAPSAKRLAPVADYNYHVVAEVVIATQEICVLDFGVSAYSESSADLRAGLRAGMFVEGEIGLGIDPFFYFESLFRIPEVPPLIYEWRIDSIEEDTTPWVATGNRGYVRDEGRRSCASVKGTDESLMNDPVAAGSYVMHCTKLDSEPIKTFTKT